MEFIIEYSPTNAFVFDNSGRPKKQYIQKIRSLKSPLKWDSTEIKGRAARYKLKFCQIILKEIFNYTHFYGIDYDSFRILKVE